MNVTRRFWTVAGIGGVFAALAVLAAQPRWLLGTIGIGAWLLGLQYAAYRSLREIDEGLRIEYDLDRPRLPVEQTVQVRLTVELAVPTASAVTVTARPPTSARGTSVAARRVRLAPGTTGVGTEFTLTMPVAGEFDFDAARVEVRGAGGCYAETLVRGPQPAVTVEPRYPRNLHVGQGGESVESLFGEHPTKETGPGLLPDQIRQYVPGDSMRYIDWKATARLADLHIQQFETETERKTVLVVDHRSTLEVGREGETMLDYLREVAMGAAGAAEEQNDPLRLYTVGNNGITTRQSSTAALSAYEVIRRRLLDLSALPAPATADHHRPRHRVTADTAVAPEYAERIRSRLSQSDTRFATTLRPYLESTNAYVSRLSGDSLFQTMRTIDTRQRGTLWTVLFTDDAKRASLRETVKLARRNGNYVMLFLAPRVLYEPDASVDEEAAYERYRSFENFRQELNQFSRVAAFEVAPGNRLDALLDAHRLRMRQPA